MSNPGSSTMENQIVDNAESLCGHCNKYIKGGSKKKSLSKLHWYCLICDRMAVNFMKTMANLHTKHQLLADKVDNLEEEIKSKVDKGEVDQLKK